MAGHLPLRKTEQATWYMASHEPFALRRSGSWQAASFDQQQLFNLIQVARIEIRFI